MKEKMKNLLSLLYKKLPEEDCENAMDLINYDEYGIALELICTQLYEREISITNDAKKIIIDLIIDMELDLELADGIRIEIDGKVYIDTNK